MLWIGCSDASDPIPAELLQVWTTDNPAYQGRSFELRDDAVVFGTGPYSFAMHFIEHVEANPVDGGIEYRLDCKDNRQETSLVRFIHTPGNPATIRMSNRNVVWKPQVEQSGGI
jgi:hypothetical protein